MPIYFNGTDTDHDASLWISNGTAGGTWEIGGKKNAGISGTSPYGLDPTNIMTFDGGILFAGRDAEGSAGLWVSDGTAKGTYEIGGYNDVGVVGAAADGLQPQRFTTFGKKALFYGVDSKGDRDLWVTNGTAAGTQELGGLGGAGIKGASAKGLQADDVIGLGNKALFWGLDTAGHVGLWVTDGTTGGTVEIGGAKGAQLKGWDTTDANPHGSDTSFVVNGRVMFNAYDTTGHNGLWVSFGSLRGTFEFGGLGNAGSGASANGLDMTGLWTDFGKNVLFETNSGLWITDGTAYGTNQVAAGGATSIAILGGKAIFAGQNGLEITDGTASRTTYIGGAGNAGIKGIDSTGLSPQDLVSIGNAVIFVGNDASNHASLWVSNGTAAGTREIGGLENRGVAGAPAGGIDPYTLTASGGYAYFELYANGHDALWVTDGTAAGTHAVRPGAVSYPKGLTPAPPRSSTSSAQVASSHEDFGRSLAEVAAGGAGHSERSDVGSGQHAASQFAAALFGHHAHG